MCNVAASIGLVIYIHSNILYVYIYWRWSTTPAIHSCILCITILSIPWVGPPTNQPSSLPPQPWGSDLPPRTTTTKLQYPAGSEIGTNPKVRGENEKSANRTFLKILQFSWNKLEKTNFWGNNPWKVKNLPNISGPIYHVGTENAVVDPKFANLHVRDKLQRG